MLYRSPVAESEVKKKELSSLSTSQNQSFAIPKVWVVLLSEKWEEISDQYMPSNKIDNLCLLEFKVATSFPFSFCYKGRLFG